MVELPSEFKEHGKQAKLKRWLYGVKKAASGYRVAVEEDQVKCASVTMCVGFSEVDNGSHVTKLQNKKQKCDETWYVTPNSKLKRKNVDVRFFFEK